MSSYHTSTNDAMHFETKSLSLIDAVERFDSYPGIVIGYAHRGVRIRIENGLECFCFGNATIGDVVLVSIQRIDYDRGRVLGSLDSFLEYSA